MKKPEVSKKQMAKVHPYIPEAFDQMNQGRISRREFLRISTLLGMSAVGDHDKCSNIHDQVNCKY